MYRFACWVILSCFSCCLLAFFFNFIFSKTLFMNTSRVSNHLGPDQDRHSVGPNIWVQTVFKGYQQTTRVSAGKERVKSKLNLTVLNPDISCFENSVESRSAGFWIHTVFNYACKYISIIGILQVYWMKFGDECN